MAQITKLLGIAISDADAGRITKEHLLQMFQEAIDNGDVLEKENEFYVVSAIVPLVDRGVLHSSRYLAEFEERMNKELLAIVAESRVRQSNRKRFLWLVVVVLIFGLCVIYVFV